MHIIFKVWGMLLAYVITRVYTSAMCCHLLGKTHNMHCC